MSNNEQLTRLLWDQPSPPRRGPRPTLTIDRIVRTGIDIADKSQLAAVTMQQVGEALGVTKMALYRYVPGKAELVALMTDVAIGTPPETAAGQSGWRDQLDCWSRHMFQLFRQHPWVMETTVGNRVMGPNEVTWIERVVAALTDTGLNGSEQLDIAATLAGHVRSIVQQSFATDQAESQSPETTLAGLLAEHTDRYPALTAALHSANQPPNSAFDFGLARILDGVEVLIKQRALPTYGVGHA